MSVYFWVTKDMITDDIRKNKIISFSPSSLSSLSRKASTLTFFDSIDAAVSRRFEWLQKNPDLHNYNILIKAFPTTKPAAIVTAIMNGDTFDHMNFYIDMEINFNSLD